MILGIIGIICITVAAIVAICKYYDYINPYVDEEVGRISLHWGGNYDSMPAGHDYRYKRTWKNGKVKYITKRVW